MPHDSLSLAVRNEMAVGVGCAAGRGVLKKGDEEKLKAKF